MGFGSCFHTPCHIFSRGGALLDWRKMDLLNEEQFSKIQVIHTVTPTLISLDISFGLLGECTTTISKGRTLQFMLPYVPQGARFPFA